MKQLQFKRRLLTGLLFISNFIYSQTFMVNANKLNVREQPDKNSTIIHQLDKGTEVEVISKTDDWIKIEVDNKAGYINKRYLTENSNEITSKKDKGFVYGFKLAFSNCFIWILLIIGGFDYSSSKKIADARFKKGYREMPVTISEILKYTLYSLIICSIIGLIMGIYYWL